MSGFASTQDFSGATPQPRFTLPNTPTAPVGGGSPIPLPGNPVGPNVPAQIPETPVRTLPTQPFPPVSMGGGGLGDALYQLLYNMSGMPQTNPTGGVGGRYYDPNYAMIGTRTAPLSFAESMGVEAAPDIAKLQLLSSIPGFEELRKTLGGGYASTENPFFKNALSSSYEALQPAIAREQSRLTGQATLMGQGGGVSSPLMGQSRELSENVLNTLGADVSNKLFGEYGRERGYQNAAMGQALGMPSEALGTLFGAGGLERGIAQSALDSMYQDFLRQQGIEQENQAQGAGLVGGYASQKPQPVQYGASPFQSLLGGAASLLTSPMSGTWLGKLLGK
jgi:hypothetical protein